MTTPTATTPTVKKRHLPAVGIIGLVLIAAAAGAVAYTQFLHPPSVGCQVIPVHRIYVMNAIIHERGGFNITAAYRLNSTATALPAFNSTTGPVLPNTNTTQLTLPSDKSLISANVGDTVTLYIHSINSTDPLQQPNLQGHGFSFDSTSFFNISNSTIPTNTFINFKPNPWYTISLQFKDQGQTKYRCTQTCSAEHPLMNGNIQSGCGG